MTICVIIFGLLSVSAGTPHADEMQEAMDRYYLELKKHPNASAAERKKIEIDTLGPAERNEALKHLESVKQAAALRQRDKKAADLAHAEWKKKGQKGEQKKVTVSPTPVGPGSGGYSVSQPRAAQPPSGGPAPAPGYSGPVEGGGVTEVIEFNPQPMKAPTPKPIPSKKR